VRCPPSMLLRVRRRSCDGSSLRCRRWAG
jgi:hypothetical protein